MHLRFAATSGTCGSSLRRVRCFSSQRTLQRLLLLGNGSGWQFRRLQPKMQFALKIFYLTLLGEEVSSLRLSPRLFLYSEGATPVSLGMQWHSSSLNHRIHAQRKPTPCNGSSPPRPGTARREILQDKNGCRSAVGAPEAGKAEESPRKGTQHASRAGRMPSFPCRPPPRPAPAVHLWPPAMRERVDPPKQPRP